jgi:hypothetical protein
MASEWAEQLQLECDQTASAAAFMCRQASIEGLRRLRHKLDHSDELASLMLRHQQDDEAGNRRLIRITRHCSAGGRGQVRSVTATECEHYLSESTVVEITTDEALAWLAEQTFYRRGSDRIILAKWNLRRHRRRLRIASRLSPPGVGCVQARPPLYA